MNILLTCVGRRSYIVDYFKQAVGVRGKVIATNSIPNTTGMLAADIAYVVPAVYDLNYINTLLDICEKEKISAVVSLFDIDLPYLASSVDKFEERGVKVWVSDPRVVEIANDKYKTFLFLTEHGFRVPKTYLYQSDLLADLNRGKIDFPIVVKPRFGMGSISIFTASDVSELYFIESYVIKRIRDSYISILSKDADSTVIFQEYIEGQEYALDIFNSYDCKTLSVVAKKKLEMRAGETDGAVTIKWPALETLGWDLGKLFKHRGNMDVDAIWSERLKQIFILEVNPRFGGGYPFSHLAGVNFPMAIVQITEGKAPDMQLFTWKEGITGLKYIFPKKVSPDKNHEYL